MPTRYITLRPFPYFGVCAQRQTILARLARGPATCRQLSEELNIPSPTKRLSELHGLGLVEAVGTATLINPDGTVNTVRLYGLAQQNSAQADLFSPCI